MISLCDKSVNRTNLINHATWKPHDNWAKNPTLLPLMYYRYRSMLQGINSFASYELWNAFVIIKTKRRDSLESKTLRLRKCHINRWVGFGNKHNFIQVCIQFKLKFYIEYPTLRSRCVLNMSSHLLVIRWNRLECLTLVIRLGISFKWTTSVKSSFAQPLTCATLVI